MNRYAVLTATAGLAVALAWSTHASAAAPAQTLTVTSARRTVIAYFRALETGRFQKACWLLGNELLAESGGPTCPEFLRNGMPDPLRWRILGSRPLGRGVGIVLRLGQNELDHVRMRTWLAVVRLEWRSLRIVETRLLD
jgi:hypothetical protein